MAAVAKVWIVAESLPAAPATLLRLGGQLASARICPQSNGDVVIEIAPADAASVLRLLEQSDVTASWVELPPNSPRFIGRYLVGWYRVPVCCSP